MKFIISATALSLLTLVSAMPKEELVTEVLPADDQTAIPNCLPGSNDPFEFDYQVQVRAIPRQVVDVNDVPTGGLPGSFGIYRLGFNEDQNAVCFNITHYNWRGTYDSPARTATHLHQSFRGQAGPPRIVFPNPKGPNSERNAVGCIQGPFLTGIPDPVTGEDTGNGFEVSEIVRHPARFNVDARSSLAIAGAFRGQLPRKF